MAYASRDCIVFESVGVRMMCATAQDQSPPAQVHYGWGRHATARNQDGFFNFFFLFLQNKQKIKYLMVHFCVPKGGDCWWKVYP